MIDIGEFAGIPREKIDKIIINVYISEKRFEKLDSFGKISQSYGVRDRMTQQCILRRGDSDKFEFENLLIHHFHTYSHEVLPEVLRREAAKSISCQQIKSAWSDWR